AACGRQADPADGVTPHEGPELREGAACKGWTRSHRLGGGRTRWCRSERRLMGAALNINVPAWADSFRGGGLHLAGLASSPALDGGCTR
ncbi:MAG: hypothetical protein ACKOD9_06150, partial [Rubrivivax sp.]